MAMSDDDKKAMTEVFAAGVAAGLAKFRSDTEEAEAKKQKETPEEKPKEKKDGNGGDGGFSFAGFFLGE